MEVELLIKVIKLYQLCALMYEQNVKVCKAIIRIAGAAVSLELQHGDILSYLWELWFLKKNIHSKAKANLLKISILENLLT